jgi:hypothetical protein
MSGSLSAEGEREREGDEEEGGGVGWGDITNERRLASV